MFFGGEIVFFLLIFLLYTWHRMTTMIGGWLMHWSYLRSCTRDRICGRRTAVSSDRLCDGHGCGGGGSCGDGTWIRWIYRMDQWCWRCCDYLTWTLLYDWCNTANLRLAYAIVIVIVERGCWIFIFESYLVFRFCILGFFLVRFMVMEWLKWYLYRTQCNE